MALGHSGGNGADANLGNELDRDVGVAVGVLQVEDQLRKVLDRVNVVVRRRGDQAHARSRVAQPCDCLVDLVAWELAALARLCALGNLDLQLIGVRQVVRCDAEATGRNLLDLRAALVPEARGVFAALAGVGAPADAVHGARQSLVCLGRDRAETHRAGAEALDDLRCWLHVVQWQRFCRVLEIEQPAQRAELAVEVVDRARVLFVGLPVVLPNRVLQAGHGVGVQQVLLAAQPVLVLAADREICASLRSRGVSVGVLLEGFAC